MNKYTRKNILIVEDDYSDKTKQLSQLISSYENCEVHVALCVRDALLAMSKTLFDLVIIDIQIPEFLGDEIQPDGGITLLSRIEIDKRIYAPIYILGLTSHGETFKEYSNTFLKKGWILFEYDLSDSSTARQVIKNTLERIHPYNYKVDVAVIVALDDVELNAVLNNDCNWEKVSFKGDHNIYYLGTVTSIDNETKTILVTSTSRMGIAASSSTTTRICLKFKPDLVIMTGIAGGVEGKVSIGDVLVADVCWEWDGGKLASDSENNQPIIKVSPYQLSMDESSRSFFKDLSRDRSVLNNIYESWNFGGKPDSTLKLHVGPIATGSSVVASNVIVDKIVSQHRETLGIEMEGYGFLYAANSLPEEFKPKALLIKSVCDYANAVKNDHWQHYCAYTSTAIAFKYIENHSLKSP